MTPLLVTVPEAYGALSIGRTKFYELVAAGDIRTVRIDGGVRVVVTSIQAYLERLLTQED